MKIVIEIEDSKDMEIFFKSVQALQTSGISVKTSSHIIQKGNKKVNPEAAFGIWKQSPIQLSEIRKKAWNNI